MSSKIMKPLARSDFPGLYSLGWVLLRTPASAVFHPSLCCVSTPQDKPPDHHRFNDSRIPAHVTYAYKRGATIVRNDDFYEMPEGANKTIDLLFLMANAPVSTLSLPESGSQAYVGLAKAMELATKELSEKFPAFFGEGQTTEQCERYVSLIFWVSESV